MRLRSVSSIVIAPAKTGRDKRSKTAVKKTAQANKGTASNLIPKHRKLPKVEMKFIAPIKEEIPARCKEKIAKSTDLPE